jgi:hypothetical protein
MNERRVSQAESCTTDQSLVEPHGGPVTKEAALSMPTGWNGELLPGKKGGLLIVGANPREVAVAKDGTGYVANQNDGTVSMIPAGASSVALTIQFSSTPGRTSNPHGIAVGLDRTVYVTNITANDVAVIKPGDAAVAYRVAVPGGPKEVVVGLDGTVSVL